MTEAEDVVWFSAAERREIAFARIDTKRILHDLEEDTCLCKTCKAVRRIRHLYA